MIVKTDGYNREQIEKVVNLRATVEGLKLGPGVLDQLGAIGEKTSLRFVPRRNKDRTTSPHLHTTTDTPCNC
jgi:DNA helicase TIP49 (TBP-interacting protein)